MGSAGQQGAAVPAGRTAIIQTLRKHPLLGIAGGCVGMFNRLRRHLIRKSANPGETSWAATI
jgi:hypothetical protein